MRVLFLSPYPPTAVRVRPYHWIRSLAALGAEVHLVAVVPPEDAGADPASLMGVCSAVEYFPLSRMRTLANAGVAVFGREPLQARYAHLPAAEHRVAELARTGRFDVVHVEHLRGVVLARQVEGVARVVDAVDAISRLFDIARREAPARGQRLVARLDLERTRRFEGALPFDVDATVVAAEGDRQAFVTLAGAAASERVHVVPNGVDTDAFRPGVAERSSVPTVVFSAKQSYHANEAAARDLLDRVMPRVWAARADVRVLIVGKSPPGWIEARARRDARVVVTGFVENMAAWLGQAWVAVCPLRYAVGIQNKVLEAMACGLPVVATPPAADALAGAVGKAMRVAPDAEGIASEVLRLIESSAERDAMGQAARRYVEIHHAWISQARALWVTYDEARRRFARSSAAS